MKEWTEEGGVCAGPRHRAVDEAICQKLKEGNYLGSVLCDYREEWPIPTGASVLLRAVPQNHAVDQM